MVLLQKKLGKIPHFNLDRRKLDDILKKHFEKGNKLFLFGMENSLTTELIYSYADELYKGRFGYYLMDPSDNSLEQFYGYFKAVANNAGYRFTMEESEEEEMADQINRILNMLELSNDGEHLWIFDRVDFIKDEEVLDSLCRIIRYLPDNDRIILVSNVHAQKTIRDMINEGIIIGTGVGPILHDHIMRVMGYHKSQMTMKRDSGWNSRIYRWIEKNIWNNLNKEEQYLLCACSVIKCISPKFYQKFILSELDYNPLIWLNGYGLLIYNEDAEDYMLPIFMEKYIAANVTVSEFFEPLSLLKNAFSWFVNENRVEAAFACLLSICDMESSKENCDKLLAFCDENIYKILHISDVPQLLKCVQNISAYYSWKDMHPWKDVEIYLKGIIALRTMNFYGVSIIELRLKELADQYKEENKGMEYHRCANFFLNVCYQDSKQSLDQWMKYAEDYMADLLFVEQGPVFIHDYTRNVPSFLNGIRNLSEWFVHGPDKEKDYEQRFNTLIHPTQRPVFEIARMEYLLESDREEESVELFRKSVLRIQTSDSEELMGGLMGVVIRLYQYGCIDMDAFKIDDTLKIYSRKKEFCRMENNIMASLFYSSAYISSKTRLSEWVGERKRGYNLIDQENLFMSFIQAKALLMFRQFEKSRNMFNYMVGYFDRIGIVQGACECRFCLAVCNFALGETEEAIDRLKEIIPAGKKLNAVKTFCSHGEEGLKLLLEYQKRIRKMHEDSEYLARLVCCAKKEVRRNNFHEYEIASQLTKSERKVLELISLGYTNLQIAEELKIKIPTAKTHVSNLFKKLGVKNRVEAIQKSKELRLLT